MPSSLYDFIYVDLEKVISVYSQITGGIVEVLERSSEHSQSADNKRNYDFKIFKHDAGGTANDKNTSKETIKPHHALLKETEDALASKGFLADLTKPEFAKSFRDSEFRARLKDTFCIKVRGRAVIEDYARMKSIALNFPEVTKFINKAAESTLLSSPAYLEMKNQLATLETQTKSITDRNARSAERQKVQNLKKALEDFVATTAKISTVDQWILDGLKTWIDAFLPGIINFRIYSNPDLLDEHVFGHLKKNCFEDPETNSFHFTYGSFPTEELTLVGIITSVPAESGENFKPLAEFEKDQLADYESVEKAFRSVFRGFDGFEQMIRTSRFPRVLVYPLMVYRSVSSKEG